MADDWSFYAPTRIVFGAGTFSKLGEESGKFGAKKALVVAGGAARRNGWLEAAQESLGGIEVVFFEGVEPNPYVGTVQKIRAEIESGKIGLVVGLGGGSVLDAAKLAANLAGKAGTVEEYLSKSREISARGVPFIAIPTTAGTGSEVTRYSVLTDEKTKNKLSVASDFLCPDAAIVDPELAVSMPPHVTASTGLDAWSQGLEPYWSVFSNPVSDVFAEYVIERVPEVLPQVIKNPKDVGLRTEMAKIALFSGLAINSAGTTASHAISYALTSEYGIAHGHAVALTLGPVMTRNAKSATTKAADKIEKITKLLVGTGTVSEAAEKVRDVIEACGLKAHLGQLGITREDIPAIAGKAVSALAMRRNPIQFTKEDVESILLEVL